MQRKDLGRYINEQHLNANALQTFASAFHKNKTNVLQIDNFLTPAMAEHCSHFLSLDARYDNFYGLFSKKKKHVTDKAEWLKAPENERFFCYEMLNGHVNDPLNINAITFLKLRHFLESDLFLKFTENVTERNLRAVTPVRIHRMQTGHFLKPHNDRVKNREIAFIIYLSPAWLPEYGGNLHIIDHDDSELILNPVYNRLLMFDVNQHKHHFISEIFEHGQIGQRHGRLSINGWFYGVEVPKL
jgi:Rps23 Pro-64 3,4-dihydroxylase Tpa1-like proline 4-hydroxylase